MHCSTSLQQEAIFGGFGSLSAIRSSVQDGRGSRNGKRFLLCLPWPRRTGTLHHRWGSAQSPHRTSASVILTTLATSFGERTECNFQPHELWWVWPGGHLPAKAHFIEHCQEKQQLGWWAWPSRFVETSGSSLVGKGRPDPLHPWLDPT